MQPVKIVECPRDAMQGWPYPISTDDKVRYLNSLLKVGFDTIDFGSFVSPKAIPQMADTLEVLNRLDLSGSRSSLLAIVANLRGAEDAARQEGIRYLGFPFSVSPEFQRRNANSTPEDSFDTVCAIAETCARQGKELVIYISMGFGNPYGDYYDEDLVMNWVGRIAGAGIKIISIADTVGLATAAQVSSLMNKLIPAFPALELGVHLHSSPAGREAKLAAALGAGCRRFDGALRGIGGCPMAGDELVGNMDTEFMLDFFERKGYDFGLDKVMLKECSMMAAGIFSAP